MCSVAIPTEEIDPRARILIVAVDSALARSLRARLGGQNYAVEVVPCGPRAQAAYNRFRPDAVLVDFDAGATARDLVREVRSRAAVPIVVISERDTERDRVAAIEMGADDYLAKPLPMDELLARIRVALRHRPAPSPNSRATVRAGDLVLDPEHRLVLRAGRVVRLTPTEYDLLALFATYPDKFLTYRNLIEGVWGRARYPREHTLHVYIARLRRKLEIDPAQPRYLLTEPGAGYRFVTDS